MPCREHTLGTILAACPTTALLKSICRTSSLAHAATESWHRSTALTTCWCTTAEPSYPRPRLPDPHRRTISRRNRNLAEYKRMALTISSSFDAGNIRVAKQDGDRADLEIVKDHMSDFYQWFHFRVAGAAGRE